jgi:hypothetical protein
VSDWQLGSDLQLDSEPTERKPSTSVRSADPAQWARRRRPRPKTSTADKRSEAATSVTSLATSQKLYYDEKLVMELEEHEIKMQLLRIKKELLEKQLAKFHEE